MTEDRRGPSDRSSPRPDSVRILERGRFKAHRPLPTAARAEAVARGLAAYDRGEFYLAHEELEPAWMGSDDPAERALLSGMIKLAAGFVHAARGNPAGVRTNLAGARARLTTAAELRAHLPGEVTVDPAALVRAIDAITDRLDRAAAPEGPARQPDSRPPFPVAGPPSRRDRAPLAIDPPALQETH